MNRLEILKQKIDYAKKAPLTQLREASVNALDHALLILEENEKRLNALESGKREAVHFHG